MNTKDFFDKFQFEIADAVNEIGKSAWNGCCGAGRHLIKISKELDHVYYVHDSAIERNADEHETGEYLNLYEECCSQERDRREDEEEYREIWFEEIDERIIEEITENIERLLEA